MDVVWSKEATEDYLSNIEYLLIRWSERSASNFIDEVDEIINLIKLNPEAFPTTTYKGVRRVVVRKQITLYYKAEKGTLTLIRFWNNYKNPKRLRL